MPVSLTCPSCHVRLKAPDGSAGRTFPCPRCRGAVVVPGGGGPAAEFAFDHGPADSGDTGNPFEDDHGANGPDELTTDAPRKARRPTAKKKAKPGYNPFDEEAGGAEPAAASPPKKRRYRKDADYNPFGDMPEDEEPDPTGDGFEFGLEAPPPAPTGEFDFGPPDTRVDDPDGPRRRR